MDNIFLELFDQIVNMDDKKIDEIYDNYKGFISSLQYNEGLINDLKQKFKIEGATAAGLIHDKEELIKSFNETIDQMGIQSKQKDLASLIKDSIPIIYDKILEHYDFICINIPVELCHKNAKMPTYAHENDAGFDLYIPEDIELQPHSYGNIVKIGIKMAIPNGYELQIRPRSGMSIKTTLRISNTPGTIDSGYRDEIGVICDNIGDSVISLKAGNRIAQGVLNQVPKGMFQQIEDITKIVGNRGGGFGSTGK